MTSRAAKQKQAIKLAERAFDRALGARIRQRREDAGLKQDSLAVRLETTLSRISHIELGTVSCRPAMLVRIAEAMGVEPGELINGLKVEIEA